MPPDPSEVPSRISAPPPLPKFLYRTAPFSVASGSKPIVTVAADVVLASTTDKPSAAPKASILPLNDLLKSVSFLLPVDLICEDGSQLLKLMRR
jgi:hypothetical protein